LEHIIKEYSVVNFVILTILRTLVVLVPSLPQFLWAGTLVRFDEPFILIVSKDPDEAAKGVNENSAQEMQAFLDEIQVNLPRVNILIKIDSSPHICGTSRF
jgi:hypothetical protein